MIQRLLQISLFVPSRAGLVACLVVFLAACHSADITHCPLLDCPGSKVCDGLGGCALPEQLDTCATKQPGDSCSYRDETGAQVGGQCTAGVCLPLGCGNSRVTPDEACDDGNNQSGDGCAADCRSDETCGNGSIDTAAAEQCDDGNVVDGDGCQASCRPGRCGDGITDSVLDEECDAGDANSLAPDAACRPTCEKPRCGDNVLDTTLGETCDDGNNQSADGCSGDCRSTEFCGNNVVDALGGEVCDDGNTASGDGCAGDCKSLEVCGNNVIDAARGEVCDDNNTISGDGCSSDCKSLEVCGNTVIDAVTEQCDLGGLNSNDPDSMCRTSCMLPICGDTIIDPKRGEQCDQGLLNADAANACRTNCQNPRCGDAISDTGEVCDDGNTTSGDNCSADCKSLETCGNSIIDVAKGEQCDNGGANSESANAACRTDCKLRRCGDLVVDTTFGESCDLGAANSNAANAACRTNCTPKRCGDGIQDTGEVCDDGNTTSGDSCSSDCTSLEVCGNGIVDPVDGEQCDAGTGVNADAPNAPCRLDCSLPRCGDMIVDATSLGEDCDLGTANSNSADATCRINCQPRRCGDGIQDVAAGEVCDDGNVVSGDNCSANCLSLETCGNSIIDVAKGEQCDAGTGINANTADAPCRLDCKLPRCGDNITDPLRGEACDLGAGNSNVADATCRTNCQPQRCGDMIQDPGHLEVCDDGNTTSGDDCSADCLSDETCGNGIIDVVNNEQCDNGGLNANTANATCRTTCQRRTCGDAIVDNAFGEACDLGAANSDAANAVCRRNCTPQRCGDGILDLGKGEVCDDANNTGGDGCSGDCKSLEICRNGIVDPAAGEQCDDNNSVDLDACRNDCTLPLCGDGKQDFNEQCDLGGANSQNPNALCRLDCTPRRCGDGVMDPANSEVCDDGNSTLSDGCRPDCLSNETCGNGILDPEMGESCDDGNTIPFDGCSACEPEEALTYRPGLTPPKRQQHVLVYDGARQRVVMFGGRDGTVLLGDTWEWDGVAWTQMSPEHAPPPRYAAAAAYDAKRKRVVIFGGTTSAVASADTWEYDGVDWTQRSPATVPSARTNAAASFDANRGSVIMFGGSNGATPNQETWEYNGTNWSLLAAANPPSARSGARMAFDSDPTHKYIVMVGGTPVDTHTYTFNGTSWSDRGSTAGPTTGDSGNGLAFDANLGKVVLWGGVADTTYEWSGSAWTPVTIASSTPTTPRSFITATYDAARKQMVLFGGTNGATPYADTWLRTGSAAWAVAPAFTEPSARMRSGLGFDPLRKRVVLFGGQAGRTRRRATAGVTLGDTWEWDGRQWAPVAAVSPPTARASGRFDYDHNARALRMYGGDFYNTAAASESVFTDMYSFNGATWTLGTAAGTREVTRIGGMAFDIERNRVATFGGTDVSGTGTFAGGGVASTWTWSAATGWTQPANTLPAGRRHPQMAYDAARKRTVLFAGVSSAGATIDDTWEWNGTAWAQITATGPTPRSGGHLVYNPDVKHVVLYGSSSLSAGEDLWEWTGTAWQERSLVTTVAERYHSAVTYDAANHALVAFGGRTSVAGTPPTTGTTLVKHRPNAAVETCTSSQIDYDNDGKAGCADEECWAQCNPLCAPGFTCAGTEPRCGDGTCQSTQFETSALCPADCGASTGTCGNFQCDTGETVATCPNDC